MCIFVKINNKIFLDVVNIFLTISKLFYIGKNVGLFE
jgi:hypothetical protein